MLPLEMLRLTEFYGQVTCEASWKWNTLEKPLTDYDLWYVWDGEGTLSLNGEEYALSKGSCFLFRIGDLTYAQHNPLRPLTVTYLHFSIDSDGPDIASELPAPYRIVRDTLTLETYLYRYVSTLNEKSYEYEKEAKLLLSLMLQQLNREQAEAVRPSHNSLLHIHEIANYIRQHPSVWHTVAELSERAGFSPRYFSLKFKEVMSISVETFIIQARIRRAEHLLKYNQMSVSDVADALGYKNMYYFSRQFKVYTGLTPSQVRKG